MPDYEIGDLVKVPSPYTNRPVQQRRPAVVVGRSGGPGAPDLLWVLMVTSAGNRAWPGDVVVSDLEEAGLPAPSLVRTAKIATIETLDAQRIGRLSARDRVLVSARIRACLGNEPIR